MEHYPRPALDKELAEALRGCGLFSDAGEAAMASLKSARDQLNAPGQVNLMLVMSGSDRDKLLRLVNTNGAPFYGSQIHRLSELDAGFVDFIAQRIEQQRPGLIPVDRTTLNEVFRLFGHRPQFFVNAVGEALNPLADPSQRFERRVADTPRWCGSLRAANIPSMTPCR